MRNHPRTTKIRVDRDGVRVSEPVGLRKSVVALCGLLVVTSVAVVIGVRWLLDANAAPAADSPPKWVVREIEQAPMSPAPDGWHAVARKEPSRPAPTAEESLPEDGGPPTREEPNFTIDASGERTGIGLFPPAGTKPIQRGLLVPDDFELPPGYVRHFQATDDGQRVPAILKFHPDYEWLDASGQPVPLPADGIVPPELAPAGMPIQMLEPVDPARESDEAP